MTEVDYIVVGCGLASIAFCEQLRSNRKSFIVFDNQSQQSSIVAAGLYNPVVLKRFTPVWKVKEQLQIALPQYAKIEKDLKIKIDYKLQILRRFASVEEQNMWFSASDKITLEDFLSITLLKNKNQYIDAPFGFGEVLHAGRLDTETLIKSYKTFLSKSESLQQISFDYSTIQFKENHIIYNAIKANNIVFAEGFGVKQNPFFRDIPLEGTKGEVLTIKAPDLKIDYAIKSSVFIIPIGNNLYTVGSTYNWDDKTNLPTQKGELELLTKLRTFITCDFEVVNHVAGVRPTVPDRRPLVGQHKEHKNLYVLNGLGSRGVMVGPYVAKQLYNFIENNTPIDKEICVNRYS